MSASAHAFEPAPLTAGSYVRAATMALLAAALMTLLLLGATRVQNREHHRQLTEQQVKSIAAIKKDPYVQTNVYDPSLVELIAQDPQASANATTLVFRNIDFSTDDCESLSQLKNLQYVGFHSCQGIDALLHRLEGARSVEKIFFENSELTDNCVRLLATLPRLRQVHLEQTVSRHHFSLLHALLPGVSIRTPYPVREEPAEYDRAPPLR
jgi:hypothetical protein